jgi:hypothetical protein
LRIKTSGNVYSEGLKKFKLIDKRSYKTVLLEKYNEFTTRKNKTGHPYFERIAS